MNKEMKQFKFFGILMMLVLAGFGFTACSSDDDDNGGTAQTPNRLRPFIGLWEIEASDYYHYETYPNYKVFFYQDPKCEIIQINNDKRRGDYYSWDYDESTKCLSIAGIAKGQWQITSVGNDAWSGLAMWHDGNNGYSAKKDNDIVTFLLSKKWYCDNTIEAGLDNTGDFIVGVEYTWHDRNEIRKESRYSFQLKNISSSPLTITEDMNNDIIKVQKEYKPDPAKEEVRRRYMTIEIVHPYSYKDVYLNVFCRHYDASFSGKFVPKR